MPSLKKNRTLIILGILVILIIARVLISNFSTSEDAKLNQASNQNDEINTAEISAAIAENNDLNANAETDNGLLIMEANCLKIKDQFSNLTELKKSNNLHNLFYNVHKEIDGKVFRLRFFYKDGPNTEISTYLVYEEDINEEELIIENTAHQKGTLYKKIEASEGVTLFIGEAYDLMGEQDLFLYYENGVLKDLQGAYHFENTGLTHLECRY